MNRVLVGAVVGAVGGGLASALHKRPEAPASDTFYFAALGAGIGAIAAFWKLHAPDGTTGHWTGAEPEPCTPSCDYEGAYCSPLLDAHAKISSMLHEDPSVDGVLISYAGARLPDGSYVDTRPPGKGILMPGETTPTLNAVSVSVETRPEADRVRARVGDCMLGVPVVYSVREEWSKAIQDSLPGRPLRDDEFPGLG